jgi:hypothetical protein
MLDDIYEKHFKFKAKYPIKILFPKLPRNLTLFWASLFGEIHQKVIPFLKKYYFEPLEIQTPNFKVEDLKKFMKRNILLPRRITHHQITVYGNRSLGGGAAVYFLDATKIEDIVDFWNLRALGRTILPFPKQYVDSEEFKEIVIDFLKVHRIPWRHNPEVCERWIQKFGQLLKWNFLLLIAIIMQLFSKLVHENIRCLEF